MKGAMIYFSGTGNTEYVAKKFKEKFHEKDIEISMIDISKKKRFNDDFDFLIFGCPIHAEIYPKYFTNWVENNVVYGNGRRCLIFSTQAADTGSGADNLAQILECKGFDIAVIDSIKMPNNFYVIAFEEPSVEDVKKCRDAGNKKVEFIVEKFLEGQIVLNRVSKFRVAIGKLGYSAYYLFSKNWARKHFSVDYKLCVKCGKCGKNCPTGNISIGDKIEFKDRCMLCMKCLHMCPMNAFMYNRKHFMQFTKL